MPAAITASALDRAAACPASCVLPGARRTNAYSRFGNVVHEFLAAVSSVGLEAALKAVPEEHRPACAAIDTDELPVGDGFLAEVAFAVDIDNGTARELGRDNNRDYSRATDEELCGTVDVVGALNDGVYVCDYKSGWGELPPARENRQLKFYALAALLTYGGERAIVDIVRVRADGQSWFDRAEFDSYDLVVDFLSELREIRDRVRAASRTVDGGVLPSVAEGGHCKYCPALHVCPAKISLAASLAAPKDLTKPKDLLGLELAPENAPKALERVRQIKSLLKLAQEQIDHYARAHPIPLGGGKFYGPKETTRERLDGDVLHEVCLERFGLNADAADLASPPQPRRGTKSGLDEALRTLRERGAIDKMAPVKREILTELQSRGGIESRTTVGLGEYRGEECTTDGCVQEAMTRGGTCRLCAVDAELADCPIR